MIKFLKRMFAVKQTIKYTRYVNGYCETPCPFSKVDKHTKSAVGSCSCTCCKSFMYNDKKNMKLTCLGVCDD